MFLGKHFLSTHSVPGTLLGVESKTMSKAWSRPSLDPQKAGGVEQSNRKAPCSGPTTRSPSPKEGSGAGRVSGVPAGEGLRPVVPENSRT